MKDLMHFDCGNNVILYVPDIVFKITVLSEVANFFRIWYRASLENALTADAPSIVGS